MYVEVRVSLKTLTLRVQSKLQPPPESPGGTERTEDEHPKFKLLNFTPDYCTVYG